ncbi:MAG: hypothetical protein NTU58_04300 [Candidatus Nealsonbacteria bacterium]|nr:hypothetical protein [Candidatus Nealsonbacteria bacterium]
MNNEKELIEFEISDRCSSALANIIQSRGWQEKKSFTLSIKKGPILLFIEKLVPNCVCFFHVGCSSDSRPPNFEYRRKVENVCEDSEIKFYYERWLELNVFWKNHWFHDKNGMRDLEATALALSDPKEYTEEIGFAWTGSYEGCGRNAEINLHFKNHQLEIIRGLDEDNEEIFRTKIKSFKKSLFDFENGPLKNKKLRNQKQEEFQEQEELFKQEGKSAEDLVKELYQLFQSSIVDFEIKKP